MKRCLPIFLALLLALAPLSSFAATPSRTSRDYWVPIASKLVDPATADAYEQIFAKCAKNGSADLEEFAKACGFIPHDVIDTVYEHDFVLTRNDRDFHVVISGNLVWLVFITDQNCLCITEIITNPKDSKDELVTKLLYYVATEDPVDARKIETDLTYTYRLYMNHPIPVEHDKLNLARVDVDTLVDVGTIH